jgi:VanZ family protein
MRRPALKSLVQAAGWLCLVLVVVLSLLPHKPRSGIANGQAEHVLAYFGTAALLAWRYRTPRSRLAIGLALGALAALLETAQLMLPGRHAQIIDFAASAAGAAAGVVGALVAGRFRRRPTGGVG